MATSKIAVGLPTELVAASAARSSRTARPQVSVRMSLRHSRNKLDDLAALLEQMLAQTGGPLTAAERKDADRALGRQEGGPRHRCAGWFRKERQAAPARQLTFWDIRTSDGAARYARYARSHASPGRIPPIACDRF